MKKLFKKLIVSATLLILVLLLPARAACQGMPVYDNTNFITLGKQIIESAKQTAELLKTADFLREQKQRVEKVNNVIKQLQAVRELTKNNERLFMMTRDDLREILDSPFIKPEEVIRISDSFNAIIESSLEDLEFVEQVLTSDLFNMTDGQRTDILKEKEASSKEMVAEVKRKTQRYRDIISFRQMQDKINNRDTNY